MKRALWVSTLLLAGAVLDPVNAGEKWSLFGTFKKPAQNGASPCSTDSPAVTAAQAPLVPVAASTPGIAAISLLSSSETAAPGPYPGATTLPPAPLPARSAASAIPSVAAPAAAAPSVAAPAAPASPQAETQTPAPSAAADTAVRKVKNKHLLIDYQVKDMGPSGVMGVELWYTRDGQHWNKGGSGIQPERPYHTVLEEEGMYGFVLLAKNGLGGGKEPPKTGEPAQFWVELDTTKPVVALTGVQPGSGGQTAIITWTASDKNLSPRPISLYYTDQNGQWQPITTGMENSGSCTWRLPAGVPYSFRVRAEATDLAGNVGSGETATPVQIDTAQPVVVDIHVSAAE